MQAIIPEVDRDLLEKELEGHLLRPSNKADNLIYDITSHECPNVMREIARLREISYRDGGGATGREMDIDEMDTMPKPYHQLIVWDQEHRQIIGGYRYLLGSEAEIRDGQPFITSAHLFHYSERFIRDYLPKTIEFGRAFVQPMYQKREMGVKALFALDNIWDGIGAIMHNHPQLQYMIGKVTIYPDYNATARELIYAYLDRFHRGEEGLIAPYHPLPLPTIDKPFEGTDRRRTTIFSSMPCASKEQSFRLCSPPISTSPTTCSSSAMPSTTSWRMSMRQESWWTSTPSIRRKKNAISRRISNG